ncbi:hypothetical protein BCR37DRAFT_383818, partial [Protomyces lactucae-debilis]
MAADETSLATLRPKPSLATTAQYLRAWRKYVEKIDRFVGDTVTGDYLPNDFFIVRVVRDKEEGAWYWYYPDSLVPNHNNRVSFKSLLDEVLFPESAHTQLDKIQRAEVRPKDDKIH